MADGLQDPNAPQPEGPDGQPRGKPHPAEVFVDEIKKAQAIAKQLQPEEASVLLRQFFDQKIATHPEWQNTPLDIQRMIVDDFVGIQKWEPKNFGGRLMERIGYGEPGIGSTLGGALGGGIGAGIGRVADEGLRTLGAPAMAAGEAIDTAMYDMRGKQRPIPYPSWSGPPTGGHLRGMLPQTPGQSAELGIGASPAYLRVLRQLMTAPGGIMRGLKDFAQRIQESQRAAQLENMTWQQQGRLRALPAPGQGTTEATRLPQSPYPMPGRVYSPGEMMELRKPPQPPTRATSQRYDEPL